MELLNNLGINMKLLIAQLVNFLVLLFVLYKFAYKPVLKMLKERTEKIEKGLKNAEDSEKRLNEIAQKEKAVLTDARKDAQLIISQAEDTAKKSKEMLEIEAKNQAEKILETAKIQIEEEKQKILKEVKVEVGELIIAATEKIIGEKLDEKKDKELIDKIVHGS